jgi:hypothetical protein
MIANAWQVLLVSHTELQKKYISEGLGADIIVIQRGKRTDGEILYVKKTFFLKSKNPQVLAKMSAGRSSQTLPRVSSSIKA